MDSPIKIQYTILKDNHYFLNGKNSIGSIQFKVNFKNKFNIKKRTVFS